MEYRFTARYDEGLMKVTARRMSFRHLGRGFFVAWLAMLAIAIVLTARGDRSWLFGLSWAIAVLGGLGVAMVYAIVSRRALAALRNMGRPEAGFALGDDGLSVSSDLPSGQLKGAAIREVWCFPEAWLLFVAKGAYTTIPTSCMDAGARRFLAEKVIEHGAHVWPRLPGS